MDREEASVILRDVLSECAGSLLARCVRLVPVVPQTLQDYGSYEVHIVCMIDDDLRRCITAVAEKHKLSMKQTGNRIILSNPKL
jgi:hypothetical protein